MKKGHLSFSVLCWLNKHRCKKGKPAIYLRISVAGQRTEISTYQYVDPQQWDQGVQKVKGSSQEAANINRQLATMKGDIRRHYSLLLAAEKPVTLQALQRLNLAGQFRKITWWSGAYVFTSRCLCMVSR